MVFKRYTTGEFVARAKEVHGDKYDYSSVEYTHNKKKVAITCPAHGVFIQQARMHLKGQGCRKCFNESVRGWNDQNRVDAHNRGDTFFQGNPCSKGHTERYVCNNSCRQCAIEQRKASNLKHHPIRAKRVKNASILRENKYCEEWIANIYRAARISAKQTGVNVQVDHIIPLKAEGVCGLHVPWNLQLVTQSYNCSKRNRVHDAPETILAGGCVIVHQSALPWNLQEKI
jgi:hypothetical protein